MGVWTFHKAVVGGLPFEAVVSVDGPYISCGQTLDPFCHGSVALIVSGLRRFAPASPGVVSKPEGWWIVKYGDQERVFLRGFTPSDIGNMTVEFGLVEAYGPGQGSAEPFFRSRAWAGLIDWVARHPRLAKKAAGWDPYLPGWVERARTETARRSSNANKDQA